MIDHHINWVIPSPFGTNSFICCIVEEEKRQTYPAAIEGAVTGPFWM